MTHSFVTEWRGAGRLPCKRSCSLIWCLTCLLLAGKLWKLCPKLEMQLDPLPCLVSRKEAKGIYHETWILQCGRAKVSGLQKWFLYVRDTFSDVSFVPCPSAFGHIGFLLALTYWWGVAARWAGAVLPGILCWDCPGGECVQWQVQVCGWCALWHRDRCGPIRPSNVTPFPFP